MVSVKNKSWQDTALIDSIPHDKRYYHYLTKKSNVRNQNIVPVEEKIDNVK